MTTVHAVDGRIIGHRAQATRTAILEALKGLLNQYSAHNIQVKNATDIVGCSSAVFWQYFVHLDDAFRELAEQSVGNDELWARQARHIAGVLDEISS